MRSKRALYNIISNLLLQIVTVIYGFIVPKIIISNYGSNVNGIISSITQFLAYIVLLESGFGPVIKSILYKPIAKKDNDTIEKILKSSERFFRMIACIFLIYIILLCIFYPLLVRNDFGYVYTISLILIIAISTFAEYFFGITYGLFLQANQKTYVISAIQIVTYVLSTIVIIILAKFNVSVQLIKLLTAVIFVLRPLLQNYYVKKKYNIDLKNVKEKYEIKQKWDGLAQHVAAVIHGNTDITLLTLFCSLAEVSVYSVYYLVIKGIKSIIQAFCNSLDAAFGDMIAKNEQENLNNKFDIYEVIYDTICTIVYSVTIVLIIPFVSIYTKNITDAVYVRHLFGYLIVISEFIWAIRLPYNSITIAAGHFKETRKGAWGEAISNIIISLILVRKYGLVGVTIGTIFAMTVRTIEYVYHANKYILKRNIMTSAKKIVLVIVETVIIVLVSKYIPYLNNTSYINLIINGIITLIYSSILVILINSIFYIDRYKSIIVTIKSFFYRKNKC